MKHGVPSVFNALTPDDRTKQKPKRKCGPGSPPICYRSSLSAGAGFFISYFEETLGFFASSNATRV
jgi:hypothetical protein